MRKVVVSEGPGKDVLALPFDDAFSEYNLERHRSAGTLLLGHTSYDGFRTYWPSVADDDTAPPVEREISRRNTAIDKVVISDTLTPEQTAPWTPRPASCAGRTRSSRSGSSSAAAAVTSSSSAAGRCGKRCWSQGLVDELHIMVGPALLGDGTPVYGGPLHVPLQLIDARVLDGSQLILARYDASAGAQA